MWFAAVWCVSPFVSSSVLRPYIQSLSEVRAAGQLGELGEAVRWMTGVARRMHIARSSRSTYESQHNVFLEWCEAFRVDPLALSAEQLSECVVHFAMGHTVNSVASYLSALQNFYDCHGAGKLPKSAEFYMVLKGLKRMLGAADVVVRAKAVSLEDVMHVVGSLDPAAPDDCCFAAELIFAFFLFLRTEDHVAGRLKWKDIYLQADGSVEVVLPPGKSSREFRTVALVARPDVLDAGLWLERLAACLPPSRWVGNFPVFVSFARTREGSCNYWAVSRGQFIERLKKAVQDVLGFEPALYAGYSLRRGVLLRLCPLRGPPQCRR